MGKNASWVNSFAFLLSALYFLTIHQENQEQRLKGTMHGFRYLSVAYMAFLSLASVMALANAQDADPSPIRRQVACSNNYRCPQYSYRKSGRDCYDSFDDCACIDKYHKEGMYCVKDIDNCNYRCPEYSYRKSGRDCYDDFDDCACIDKYHKEGNYCAKDKNCDYKCPPYSYRTPGRSCYDGFGDCTCESGYMKYGNSCVKK
jgi:hypothetical protein